MIVSTDTFVTLLTPLIGKRVFYECVSRKAPVLELSLREFKIAEAPNSHTVVWITIFEGSSPLGVDLNSVLELGVKPKALVIEWYMSGERHKLTIER